MSDIFRGIVILMMQAVEIPPAPAPQRPVGRPHGAFDVALFAQTCSHPFMESNVRSTKKKFGCAKCAEKHNIRKYFCLKWPRKN